MDRPSSSPVRRLDGPSEPTFSAADLSTQSSHTGSLSTHDLNLLKPYFAAQPKSLSGIALRAFCLGFVLASSAILALLILGFTSSPLWRAPFFMGALSVFHFLEFWTTAECNTLVASIDSFLLTANWPSYAIAHASALLETLVVGYLFPHRSWVPGFISPLVVPLGLALVVVGQVVRSLAMMEAGVSFNHHVQHTKSQSHTLVTTGIYSVFRHPSYFGFFWWGLGTQLVLGNVVCFFAYAAVLWMFFSDRIRVEESRLIQFFGEEYVEYRKSVGTMIPFIR